MTFPKSFVLLLLSAFAVLSFAEEPHLAIEIFRHGARGPLNATYDDPNSWGNDLGQLTPVGQRMHYLLGVALRNKYPELITNYDPSTVYFRSTDVNRTIMSAQAHVFGLYKGLGPGLNTTIDKKDAIPPFNSEIIQKTVENLENTEALPGNLQPVPIHVVSGQEDHLLRPWDACPISQKWLKQDGKDALSKEVFEKDLKDVTAYLKGQNLNVNTIMDLYTIGDNTIANRFQGLPIPGNVKVGSKEFKSLLFATEWWAIKLFAGDQTQKALFSYNILNYIIGVFEGVTNGTSPLKYVSLSAHDTTLLTVLYAFDIVNTNCMIENFRKTINDEPAPKPNCKFPEYASNLVFEFTKGSDGKEPTIQLKYDNNLVPACGGGTDPCTLSDFKKYVAKVTNNLSLNDYRSQCGLVASTPSSSSGIWIIVLLVVCVILAVALGVTYQKLQKKAEEVNSKAGGEYYADA